MNEELLGTTVLYLFINGLYSVFKAGEKQNDSFISSVYFVNGLFALLMVVAWLIDG